MANYHTQFATIFEVTEFEAEALLQALQIDWEDDADVPRGPLQELLGERSSAIGAIFPDPGDLNFNLDLVNIEGNEIRLGGAECPNLDALANLIQLVCQETLKSKALGFEWATTCDKLRPDAFSGGWCVVSLQEIRWESTSERLAYAIAEAELAMLMHDQC